MKGLTFFSSDSPSDYPIRFVALYSGKSTNREIISIAQLEALYIDHEWDQLGSLYKGLLYELTKFTAKWVHKLVKIIGALLLT